MIDQTHLLASSVVRWQLSWKYRLSLLPGCNSKQRSGRWLGLYGHSSLRSQPPPHHCHYRFLRHLGRQRRSAASSSPSLALASVLVSALEKLKALLEELHLLLESSALLGWYTRRQPYRPCQTAGSAQAWELQPELLSWASPVLLPHLELCHAPEA